MIRLLFILITLFVVLAVLLVLFSVVTAVARFVWALGSALFIALCAGLVAAILGGGDAEIALASIVAGAVGAAFVWRRNTVTKGRSTDNPASNLHGAPEVDLHPEVSAAWTRAQELAPSQRRALERARNFCADFLNVAETLDISDAEGRDISVRIRKHIVGTVAETEAVCAIQTSELSEQAAAKMVTILTGLGEDARNYLDDRQAAALEALEMRANHLDNQRRD